MERSSSKLWSSITPVEVPIKISLSRMILAKTSAKFSKALVCLSTAHVISCVALSNDCWEAAISLFIISKNDPASFIYELMTLIPDIKAEFSLFSGFSFTLLLSGTATLILIQEHLEWSIPLQYLIFHWYLLLFHQTPQLVYLNFP